MKNKKLRKTFSFSSRLRRSGAQPPIPPERTLTTLRRHPSRTHWFTYLNTQQYAACQCGWNHHASTFPIAWRLYQTHEKTIPPPTSP